MRNAGGGRARQSAQAIKETKGTTMKPHFTIALGLALCTALPALAQDRFQTRDSDMISDQIRDRIEDRTQDWDSDMFRDIVRDRIRDAASADSPDDTDTSTDDSNTGAGVVTDDGGTGLGTDDSSVELLRDLDRDRDAIRYCIDGIFDPGCSPRFVGQRN